MISKFFYGLAKTAFFALILTLMLPWQSYANNQETVLVLKSEDLRAYSEPAQAFERSLEGRENISVEIRDIELNLSQAREILREYRDNPPAVIFALGAHAAVVAMETAPDELGREIPFVFASVLEWEEYGFNTENSTGIKAQVPVQTLFAQSRMVIPDLERLGLIYSPESEARVTEAKAVGEEMGVEIVARRVEEPAEVEAAVEYLSNLETDAWWLPADPTVVTVDNFHYVREQAWNLDKPLIVYSESFVRAGGLVSVSINYHTVGSQAAAVVSDILDGAEVSELKMAEPVGTEFLGNSRVASTIGLDLTDSARFMDRVLDEIEGVE